MRINVHWLRSGWTILDQGIVSLGAFLLNILLARSLAPAEYGTLALVISTLMTLQVTSNSLIFYPMSIRATVLPAGERQRLVGRGLVLLAMLCLPLLIVIAAGLVAMGRTDLLLPLMTYFTIGQAQEALRRGLFAEFRHNEALIGDAIGYLGQVLLVLLLLQRGTPDLASVFYAMSLASGAAVLVSYLQVKADFRDLRGLRATVRDFWSLGKWSLANNLTGLSRIQILLWGLTALFGVAATASYQAAMNVINLANPILIGLCNVIPQTVARKFHEGYNIAWNAVRPYALAGALPLLLCYGVVAVAPDFVLHLLYGRNSAYVGLDLPLRILAAGALLGYTADIVCSYMHGVDSARLALLINLVGTASAALLFLPLTLAYGIVGTCTALAVSSVIRLIASQWILSRMIANGRRSVV